MPPTKLWCLPSSVKYCSRAFTRSATSSSGCGPRRSTELAELICLDALERNESCGGHFREEYQTPDGEALRNDDEYSYVAAWQYRGEGQPPELHKEPLHFDYVHPSQRSYK
jgi:hypothetical protein